MLNYISWTNSTAARKEFIFVLTVLAINWDLPAPFYRDLISQKPTDCTMSSDFHSGSSSFTNFFASTSSLTSVSTYLITFVTSIVDRECTTESVSNNNKQANRHKNLTRLFHTLRARLWWFTLVYAAPRTDSDIYRTLGTCNWANKALQFNRNSA